MSDTTSSTGRSIGQVATAIGEALFKGGAVSADVTGAELGAAFRIASVINSTALAAFTGGGAFAAGLFDAAVVARPQQG